MARIRTVKPEFWTSEQITNLSINARLLFIGLWNFCDDAGIHSASVRRLRTEIFPADSLTDNDVSAMMDEIINEGLVKEYAFEDHGCFWQVTGWHHQKIDQPTYKFPQPDGTIPEGQARRRQEDSTRSRRVFDEHPPNARRSFIGCSPPEGKGNERNGETPPSQEKGVTPSPSVHKETNGVGHKEDDEF